MSDDSSWLKNPILPRPPTVPYFNSDELEGLPDSDRRLIARTYARESRRLRSRRAKKGGSAARSVHESNAARSVHESNAPESLRRIA